MAYQYNPNNWNEYDNDKTFNENKQNDAVISKQKLDRLESAVRALSAELTVGSISIGDKAEANIETNKITGTAYLNMTIPQSIIIEAVNNIIKVPEIKSIQLFADPQGNPLYGIADVLENGKENKMKIPVTIISADPQLNPYDITIDERMSGYSKNTNNIYKDQMVYLRFKTKPNISGFKVYLDEAIEVYASLNVQYEGADGSFVDWVIRFKNIGSLRHASRYSIMCIDEFGNYSEKIKLVPKEDEKPGDIKINETMSFRIIEDEEEV